MTGPGSIDLDDGAVLTSGDPQRFLTAVEHLSDQLAEGWDLGQALPDLPDASRLDGIVVLGVGGSGISGDVFKAVLGMDCPRVVEVCRGYRIPGWIGPKTLVFAISYSGRTEETLAAFEACVQRGASTVVLATGGPLAERGAECGCPTARLRGGLQPRAALGLMLMTLLGACNRMRIGNFKADVEEATELIARRAAEYGPDRPTASNRAKQLAVRIAGTFPMIYGSEGLADAAAYRWKCQLNECTKVLATSNVFSEINHNEIMGFSPSGAPAALRAGVVMLRHSGEHPRIRDRIAITLPVIADRLEFVEEVWASGESAMARVLDLIYLGDFVATYAALAQGVDPGGIDLIDQVKRQLSA